MTDDEEPMTVDVITRPDGKFEASARQGKCAGWAIQKTESLARAKAVARLNHAKAGFR